MRFRCLKRGFCCRRYWIPVTHLDIARISSYLGVDAAEVVDLKPVRIYGSYPQIPTVLVDGEPQYLALRDREDGSCILLDPSSGKCAVHDVKPLVCRFYPFTYRLEGGEVRVVVAEGAIGSCPGLVDDDAPIPQRVVEEVRRLAERHMFEIALWRAACIEWNRGGGGSREQFLEFLRSLIERDRVFAEA
ncbi:MAG: YkgJ family cysteine cluster protein [Crenarchaeota archaeon]|nr:YkgJ family cysteine cluster protein [Thermoproteota archaeon]